MTCDEYAEVLKALGVKLVGAAAVRQAGFRAAARHLVDCDVCRQQAFKRLRRQGEAMRLRIKRAGRRMGGWQR